MRYNKKDNASSKAKKQKQEINDFSIFIDFLHFTKSVKQYKNTKEKRKKIYCQICAKIKDLLLMHDNVKEIAYLLKEIFFLFRFGNFLVNKK